MLTPNDVRYYGAKCDGVTDDTIAIQTALDTVKAAGGGKMFFPSGTCTVSSLALNVANNITLYGAGPSSIIQRIASTTPGVANFLSFANSANIVISDLNFISNVTLTSSTTLYLDNSVAIVRCTDTVVKSCYFYPGYASAVFFSSTSNSKILDNIVYGQSMDPAAVPANAHYANGFAVVDSCTNNIISGNQVLSMSGGGILVQAIANNSIITNIIVEGNTVNNCGGYGIIVYDNNLNVNGTGYISNVIVTGNTVDTVYGSAVSTITGNKEFGACIYMQGPQNSVVQGNTVNSCSIQTNGTLLTPAAIGVSNTYSTSVIGNTIRNAYQRGIMLAPSIGTNTSSSLVANNIIYCSPNFCSDSAIYLINGVDTTITGNAIYGVSLSGIRTDVSVGGICHEITMSSNVIRTPTLSAAGLFLTGCLDVTVSSNEVYSDSAAVGSGIAIFTSTNNIVITGNVITRFQFGLRYFSAAGPTATISNNVANYASVAYQLDQAAVVFSNNVGSSSGSNELVAGVGSPIRTTTVSAGEVIVKGGTLLSIDAAANPVITSLIQGYPTQIIAIRNSGASGTITINNSTTLILNGVASLTLTVGQLARFLCANNVAPLVWYQL